MPRQRRGVLRRLLPARRLPTGRFLVLYDGVCGLCDRSVRFLLAADREKVLTFATLQGATGEALAGPPSAEPGEQTVVLVEGWGSAEPRLFRRSTAALRILDAVGGAWRIVSWLRAVPRPLRDSLYRFVATRRYRWFGRFDACKLPPADLRDRFVD